MLHFVYVLRSEVDGRFYVGMTTNIDRRLQEHNKGKTRSTKGYRPGILFFFEEFDAEMKLEKEKSI